MHRVTLITVGTLKEPYLREAAEEYRTRLRAFCDLREINLPEEKIADEDDVRAVAAALELDADVFAQLAEVFEIPCRHLCVLSGSTPFHPSPDP